MKELKEYVRFHKKGILFLFLWCTIFLTILSLYQLPMEAVGYAILLCLVPAALLAAYDYGKFRNRHRDMKKISGHIHVSMEGMPLPRSREEQDYQKLVRILFQHNTNQESLYDYKYSEMIDYYTLWAHQIKTPIAAMRLLLQEEEGGSHAELQEQLFKIEEYVGMVLQFLRAESMNSDLKIRQYSLDGMVRQAVRKYSRSFIRKRLSLEYEELNQIVITDEKWLVFVLEQILSNALKYTKKGKIGIYMDETRPKTLVIEDTGIGISSEDLPRIGEKGFTGYNGRSDKKSTGIGLYLCDTILSKLNHTMEIESAEGKGTKVKLGLESSDLQIE